ncbi:MAG: radical SAM protein [Kiritimatiellaeota bacterium]|nr:radical SAM protein [Kiritimatiellota bacterium]
MNYETRFPLFRLFIRLSRETRTRALWKFLFNFLFRGSLSARSFKKRQAAGDKFPAFIVISITNECNLSCRGCWNTPTRPPVRLSTDDLNSIIMRTKKKGSLFFGILGGEPLMHPGLFDVIASHPDCYFQIFTNGTMLDDAAAAKMRDLGNVTPMISFEGDERVADERRGGIDIYAKTMEALRVCSRNGLIFGTATSVCKNNIDALVSDDFVNRMIGEGVHYIWYYIYRPVGADPAPELALNEDDILRLRSFIVDARTRFPIGVVDAYWDHEGRALCPGALGISHHINPSGGVEFCPPIQFVRDNIADFASLDELFEKSEFLDRFRGFASDATSGCVILECPEELMSFLESENASDGSGRGSAFEALAQSRRFPGHHIPGKEIPERHWFYRFAKKRFFFGFGGYG